MEHWRQVVFSRVEIWWNVGSKNGETRRWQICHQWWYGLWRRHRIEPFSRITIILDQEEWSIAKDIGPFFKRCNARHRQTFYDLGNVYVFDIGSICIHGNELLRKSFHQKDRWRAHFKKMFDISEKVDSGTIRWVFWSVSNQLWKILHGNNFLWSMMKKPSVSRMQRFIYSQILCYVLERWIRTEHQILFWEEQLSWFKDSTPYRTLDTIDGEPMEFEWTFSQDSPHCSSSTESKSSWAKWATQHNSKDELSSCRCSMTSYGERKTMKRNVLLTPHLCLYLQKDFQHDVGHSSDLDQKQSGIRLTMKDLEENGIKSLNWDQIRRKRTHSFPSHESVVSRNAQKQGRWTIIHTLLCRWWYDWNCFSHNYFF